MKKVIASFFIIFIIFSLIFCQASEINVEIDDEKIEFDVSPMIQNGRTLVPMRKIFEELGCEVEWLADVQTIIAVKNNLIIALQIGKNKVILTNIETNSTTVTELEVSPVIYNSRTFVPVRAISDCLGYKVNWDGGIQTVFIKTTE